MTSEVITVLVPVVSSVLGGICFFFFNQHRQEQARNDKEHDRLRDRVNDHETRLSKLEIRLEIIKDD